MSADEYQISMAGGDGDPLDAIQRRDSGIVNICEEPCPSEECMAVQDRRRLLALVRRQAATLAAVLELANARGRCGWKISSDEIRKALRA